MWFYFLGIFENMNIKKFFAIAAAIAITTAASALVQPADDALEARIARVENGLLTPGHLAALNVPGVSVAVINDGKIEWARGYGMADVAAGRPVTAHTRFQAASISKSLTAMATLSLVQAGKLSLDEDVNQRLRAWKVPENAYTAQHKVTLRGLLSHTAGVGVHGFEGYAAGQPLPTLLQLLDGKVPANSGPVRVQAVPGSEWKYSGGGYEIVQLLLTDTTGEPFDQFMRRTVLDPLDMRDSAFTLPAAWAPLVTHAYRKDGSVLPGGWYRYPESAAAALWTTPFDLARFAIEIQNSLAGKSNRVLSQKMTAEMLTPGIETFGLGLFLGEPGDARKSFRHSGGNQGFRNMLFAYNTTGQGAVVMTNSDNGGELVEQVLRAIAREYGWTNYLPAQ